MISAGELAFLRSECERSMEQTCQILRPSHVADAGGIATTYAVVSTIICRVAPSQHQATEREIGGALVGTAQWRVTVPAETDIENADIISVGSALSGSGLTMAQVVAGGGRVLEVVGVVGPRTSEWQRIIYTQEVR